MFDTIFTTTSDGSISLTQSVIAIGAAFIIGFVIAAVYMFICKKEGCQKNFIIGLAMLPASNITTPIPRHYCVVRSPLFHNSNIFNLT